MEKMGELASSGKEGCVNVDARSFARFPPSMGLDLVEGPTAEGKVRGSTVFNRVPVVGRDLGCVAFRFKPAVEGRLADGEDKVRERVVDVVVEVGESVECRGEEAYIGASSFLVVFRYGESDVLFVEEDVVPSEEEDLLRPNERVE